MNARCQAIPEARKAAQIAYGRQLTSAFGLILAACLLCGGCQSPSHLKTAGVSSDIPRELNKVSMPTYVIEPPDILQIEAVRTVPLPPYKIEPLDSLVIQVDGLPPDEPIEGVYPVEPEGTVNFGLTYGSVRLVGLTLEQAKEAIEKHLKNLKFKEPKAVVSVAQTRGLQQITGPHLVRPDGTVGLGSYGSAYVAGLTLQDARKAIEKHLSQYLLDPEVSVDVVSYNSKVYYVIMDGAGYGETIVRVPITGNETVLDALAQVGGLTPTSSKKHIWVARPAPAGFSCDQVLPVDYSAIVRKGNTDTNYQILAGDRIYVQGDSLIASYNWIDKIIAPFERMMGFGLLGNSFVRTFQQGSGSGTGGFAGTFTPTP